MTTKVPVTFLTATLPVRLEKTLKELIRVPDQHSMIRATTNRPEHQYILFRSAKDKLLHHAVAFIIMSSASHLHGSRRGIIFVRSKEMGESIVRLFPQMAFIHGDITDERVRNSALEKWKNGQSGGWIVGTTSLIQGVDYHNVHFVLFVATPFSMIDFVQGAGRAGRNGEQSFVVVLHSGNSYPPSKNDEDLSCRQEMVRWTQIGKCRRTVISSCMDGEEVECHSIPGAMPCDVCRRDHPLIAIWGRMNEIKLGQTHVLEELSIQRPTPGGVEPTQLEMVPLVPRLASPEVINHSLVEMTLMHARTETALECIRLLEAFSPNCAICHAESGGKKLTGRKHKTWNLCCCGQHFKYFYDWNKPRRKFVRGLVLIIVIPINLLGKPPWVYDPAIGVWCYGCALPQRALKERGWGHDMKECLWSDMIMGTAWSIWYNKDLFPKMAKTLNCQVLPGKVGGEEAWATWLSQTNSKRTAYNLHSVWLWYCKEFQIV